MDDIKKKLRSVLLSKAGGVPLKKVESDYRSLVREPLEWRILNFKSLGQFLEAIPDTVRLICVVIFCVNPLRLELFQRYGIGIDKSCHPP